MEKSTRDTPRAAGRARAGRGLTGWGGAGRPDRLADWLQAQCTGRSADAPPRPAALHAAFTCCRPSRPSAVGFCTWVRRAPGSAWPVEAPCFPSLLPVLVFQAKKFFREGMGAAMLCKFAREIGRQVVSRIPGWVGLRPRCTLKRKEIRRSIK